MKPLVNLSLLLALVAVLPAAAVAEGNESTLEKDKQNFKSLEERFNEVVLNCEGAAWVQSDDEAVSKDPCKGKRFRLLALPPHDKDTSVMSREEKRALVKHLVERAGIALNLFVEFLDFRAQHRSAIDADQEMKAKAETIRNGLIYVLKDRHVVTEGHSWEVVHQSDDPTGKPVSLLRPVRALELRMQEGPAAAQGKSLALFSVLRRDGDAHFYVYTPPDAGWKVNQRAFVVGRIVARANYRTDDGTEMNGVVVEPIDIR